MGGVLLKIGDALDRKLQQVHCKLTRLLLFHAFYGLPISALYVQLFVFNGDHGHGDRMLDLFLARHAALA
jgi:hypothetical protein